jgi:serine/threonine-protein kinase
MNLTAETALQNGKYVLDTQLSKGVFGITYRATNTESGQTVVIKTLGESLRQHSDFDQFKQQFLELAKRLSRCKHPNLVQVLDCFEEAGRPYLVMEYIPGQTLAELIQSEVLPEAKAVKYIRQIGHALSVVHKAGLLHQDVKPQNIIRRQDTDCVVLCEFGLTCEFTPGVMQTHANLLSAGYAPLEQYSFEEQRTPATDIYALAATLYCLLIGRPPLPAPVRDRIAKLCLSAEVRSTSPTPMLLGENEGGDRKPGGSVQHSDGGVSAAALQEHRLFLPDLQQSTQKLRPAVKQVVCCGLELAAQRRPKTVEAWLSLLKSQEKILKPQPALTQHLVAQPRAGTVALPLPDLPQAALKSAPTKRKTAQRPTQAKKPTHQPELAQRLVTKLRTGLEAVSLPGGHRGTIFRKLKRSKVRSPLRALILTGTIAASAGIGFGFALRINRPNEPGSTILHTEQSFPPTSNWPMSEPQL